MIHRKLFQTIGLITFALLNAGFSGSHVLAQEVLSVEVGKSRIFESQHSLSSVFVADPSVADATVSDEDLVFVFGKSAGETTIVAVGVGGDQQTSFNVIVTHPMSEIRRTLSQRFPGNAVSVTSSRGSLLLTGTVPDDLVRKTILETVNSAFPGVNTIDRLTVAGSETLRLQVRLIEINRQRAESFGIDVSATIAGSGWFFGTSNRGVLRFGNDSSASTRLDATIDLLVSNNIATINQVTELSTVIGESASFSVGGEIPVPGYIPSSSDNQNGNFRLDYQFIGTDLKFTPKRVPGNKIQLLVESSISSDRGTTGEINGNSFPNLSSRSFRTSIEVSDGVSFAIAGLSSSNGAQRLRSPKEGGLSSVMDRMFGTDTVSSATTETVVIVTPHFGGKRFQANDLAGAGSTVLGHILWNGSSLNKASLPTMETFGGFKF